MAYTASATITTGSTVGRFLSAPLREVLESGAPDFPFCICWANENWTRRWDGLEQHVLMRQDYSPRDDLAHIRYLLPYLTDARYITVRANRCC